MDEKVICYDKCNNNDFATAMMMNNQWGNNPFAYMMIMAMMRGMYGDGWQNRMAGDPEISSRFNQLSNQMSDNHNSDILNEAVKGNTARLGELASNLHCDLHVIENGICDVRSGIQGVQGDVRFTGERVINSNILGVKDMQSTFKDCCCENRLAQKDTIIAMKDQTYTINERLTGIANGLQKGFSDLGYIMAQNKGEIINNQDRNTQRVVDLLNSHWTDELRQHYNDARLELSQIRQTNDIFARLNNNG